MKFKINRFLALIRRDFVLYRNPIFLVSFALVFMIALLLFFNADDSHHIYNGHFVSGLLLVGSVFTASNFIEFRNPSDRISYLSLPASTFEKFLTHMIYCTVGFLIYWCIVFGLGHFIANFLIEYFTYNDPYRSFKPWSLGQEYSIRFTHWIIIQSGLFIFSILFNRYAFVKSLFSLVPLILFCVVVMMCLIAIIFGEYLPMLLDGMQADKLSGYTIEPTDTAEAFANNVKYKYRIIVYYCLPLFLFVVAYFKLKEKEA